MASGWGSVWTHVWCRMGPVTLEGRERKVCRSDSVSSHRRGLGTVG